MTFGKFCSENDLDNIEKKSRSFLKMIMGKEKFDKLPPNIQVKLIHANVLNISRDPKYYDLIGKQDII